MSRISDQNHIVIIHFTGQHRKYFDILDRYEAEFQEFLAGTFGNREQAAKIPSYVIGSTRIWLLFSPDDDADDFLLSRIVKAKSSLDVMMFTFGSCSPLLSGVINRFYAVKYVNHSPTDDGKVAVRGDWKVNKQCRS